MTRSLSKTIGDAEIALFAEISTDHNPVHLDEAYARDTIFEGRIAHGMLTAGADLGGDRRAASRPRHGLPRPDAAVPRAGAPGRPGRGDGHRSPTIDHRRRRVTLDCRCRVGDTVVLEGEALVLAPSRKFD